jgi:hypothetical protein
VLVHSDSLLWLPFKGNVLGRDFSKIICGGVDTGMDQNVFGGQVPMFCRLIFVVYLVLYSITWCSVTNRMCGIMRIDSSGLS